jgi:hypothetical protein
VVSTFVSSEISKPESCDVAFGLKNH